MGRHVLVVYTNPVEGEEDEYNKWYDETHLPDIVDVPGVVSGTRLKLNPVAGTGEGATHQYLALYEIDGDPAAVMAEIGARVGNGQMVLSSAADLAGSNMAVFTYRDPAAG